MASMTGKSSLFLKRFATASPDLFFINQRVSAHTQFRKISTKLYTLKSNGYGRIFNGCFLLGAVTAGIWCVKSLYQNINPNIILAKEVEDEKSNKENPQMSRRERRFHDFASCEHNGQIVMTPHDFLMSLIENHPKIPNSSKIRLTDRNVMDNLIQTPNLHKGSKSFFRDLHQDGIITFSEYLFLVTILTKSNAGLKIALKMMDENGDQEICMNEFQLVERMINKSASKTASSTGTDESERRIPRTTLLVHLFGKDGKQVVTFERFFKFMDDLQAEVLELEFHEYSKGLKSISELDFAKILLRNTVLTDLEYCEYIERLKSRIAVPKGISMDQFKAFHHFLNNIDDFVMAVNMTNILHTPIDKELFGRCVKITTGKDIDPYVVDVVFSLFDQDGDGMLSQNEFIGIMKDRLKRGFGKFPNMKGMEGFKHCLKKEMIKTAD